MGEKYVVRLGQDVYQVEIGEAGGGIFRVFIEGKEHTVRMEQVSAPSLFLLEVDSRPLEAFVEGRAGGYEITIGFHRYALLVRDVARGRPPPLVEREDWQQVGEGEWLVVSPMSGVVVEIRAGKGQVIQQGDVLMVIESMKMNNELRAKFGGAVREVYVEVGQRV